jgi:hypothetical protein
MSYPKVHTEDETIAKLREGYSISRFGDGEFKMIDGAGYVREPPNPKLAGELRGILRNPPPKLIRGIVTMDPSGPKYPTWKKHIGRFSRLLNRSRGQFYSAFISRPDSAPWIRTREFAEAFVSVWEMKRVAVLCEPESKTLTLVKHTNNAHDYLHVVCPSHGAYAHIDDFEQQIVDFKPHVALLSCGMTATCLAARLARRGIQAIDFGSGGKYLLEELGC